jgi:hypothetical protein
MTRPRLPGDRGALEGDIMVTAVGKHFAIGRLKADGKTQEFLEDDRSRAGALKRACALAGASHRVFLCARPKDKAYAPVDCPAAPQ